MPAKAQTVSTPSPSLTPPTQLAAIVALIDRIATRRAPAVQLAPLDWSTMVAVEPQLGVLIADARKLRRRGNRWRHYENLKGRVGRLAGWGARRRELASGGHYHVAHRRLLDALETGR
ncbi:MAG TPA: hypothetical protein VG826_27445 [Pirellulales bacterium]|nr:hypothetical protein [Pirellulales bacterium]